MSDNTKLAGQRDRSQVAANQDYELKYLADKYLVSKDAVKQAIQQVGNDRRKVEDYLSKHK
ncbi:DUF3606 domain-containing protein [Deminuibacter soli]|uniref:DUF3606 domain-containing protein n=1 Tax=Deminuibacter soli TaxID=2291815 RepID=A0A3E1NH62_9BACT|nr:DUF3606 domain-containing protein [Deminuibacter soli]RFM27283.1 DUF3606 domain-containing protein [Deminuibacter soli]